MPCPGRSVAAPGPLHELLLEGRLVVELAARRRGRLPAGTLNLGGCPAQAGTGLVIDALLKGGAETNSASALLSAGAIVWVSNNIAFSLLFWELESGGAAARAHRLPRHPDFAFPQQLNPDRAPAAWRPRFIDYLYLGFTNALAFSPTDTMPLVPWAKVAMAVQSLISLAILGLVVARAVNVFT